MVPTRTKTRGLRAFPIDLFLLAAAGLWLPGCGGERLYPITVSVRLPDGSAAAGCAVALQRTEQPPITAGGRVATDGTCTPFVAGRTNPGLPAGTYRVAVAPASSGPPADDGTRKPLPFASRYTDPDASGFTVKVGAGLESAVSLSLER